MKNITLTIVILFLMVEVKAQEANSIVTLKKEKPVLTFQEADMLDTYGNFNYEDEEKLPWTFFAIANFFKAYHEVVYQVLKFEKNDVQRSSLISNRIQFNEADETMDVRKYSITSEEYIDRNDNFIPIDDVGQYADELNFFPFDNLLIYKVRGEETIETAIGSFNCTVVEGIGNYDVKYKYWMINEKPGVFARVIEVRKILGNNPAFTAVYELTKID